MSIPPYEQQVDAQSLTGDGIVELFQVALLGAPGISTVFFKDGGSVTWQGNTYEGLSCRLSGIKRSATEEQTRPTLIVMNPAGIFNNAAFQGYFEGSTLIHSRILRTHLDQNLNLADVRYWRVSRVFGLISGQSISFELRTFADGPAFSIPARKYMPDAGFPFVTL